MKAIDKVLGLLGLERKAATAERLRALHVDHVKDQEFRDALLGVGHR